MVLVQNININAVRQNKTSSKQQSISKTKNTLI